jgi:xylulokinase
MSGTALGLDIGSSSIKAVILDLASGKAIAHATSPNTELEISAPKPGWAEQHPDLWWQHVTNAIASIRATHPSALQSVKAIGIAYQMHGLVLLDNHQKPLRPAIIWCDSRAVSYGEKAFKKLGSEICLKRFGNSPGNFTASKLAWVKENEPEIFRRAAHFILPGDYIALKLTAKVGTTRSGLSEGVLCDLIAHDLAEDVLSALDIPHELVAPVGDNVGVFDIIAPDVAKQLGLPLGIPISYRAGDQPNNALALNVLNPGEVAANAGTSGVVYGVTRELGFDNLSRVNNFLHVNSSVIEPRIGVLMCVNGCGSFYRWVRNTFAANRSYSELNRIAQEAPIAANGAIAIPYGNGAERTLGDIKLGASFEGIDLNRHSLSDIIRATQEGIVFALCYGVEIMRGMGLVPKTVRAGNANMFQSSVFCSTFATALGVPLELYTTDGAEGAARGAAIGAGLLSYSDAFAGLERVGIVEPDSSARSRIVDAYRAWCCVLEGRLRKNIISKPQYLSKQPNEELYDSK